MLDLSRSKNIDAGVTGSGVAGSAVAVSEPAGATSDIAVNVVNAGPGTFSDLLGTAMLCSVLAGTEVSRGVAEVINRSVPSTDSNAPIRSAESTGAKISNEIADVASVDTSVMLRRRLTFVDRIFSMQLSPDLESPFLLTPLKSAMLLGFYRMSLIKTLTVTTVPSPILRALLYFALFQPDRREAHERRRLRSKPVWGS